MIALLHCESVSCLAAFEAEGSREEIDKLRCADCGGPLIAKGWADAQPQQNVRREIQLRRAA